MRVCRVAERTRQCPPSVHPVFDPEEDEPVRREIDWDAWEKNRFTGWTRWWLVLMLATTLALSVQFLVNDGKLGP
ncbi:MAG: hypothetical protein JWO77_3324 [Ilumatobacteraceae bacterium]|nr:hypothetical protein [Ilumatobacteraceae bacterium]